MSPSSEGFYKAEISSKEIVNAVLKNIREIQEESGPKLFQHNFAESKESNSPIIQPPIIISDLLKRHGIL
jgi:hypothetical protein